MITCKGTNLEIGVTNDVTHSWPGGSKIISTWKHFINVLQASSRLRHILQLQGHHLATAMRPAYFRE